MPNHNAKYHQKSSIKPHLNGKLIDSTEEETHLGINCCTDQSNSSTVKSRIQPGRNAVIAISGASFYALYGIGPDACLKLLQAYVTPCMLYRLDVLCISH